MNELMNLLLVAAVLAATAAPGEVASAFTLTVVPTAPSPPTATSKGAPDPTPAPAPTPAAVSELPLAPVSALCTCATARDTNGWCEVHGLGYVAGVLIRSKLLYESLDAHGHTLDLSTFQCASCKKAIASDGFCEEHRIGFVHGQCFFSRLTYELTRGERKDPDSIVCRVCKKNAANHGWCSKDKLGMVGNVVIKDKDSYRRAAHAVEILLTANKAAERCEFCAVAMVTDTRCPVCRITYKDGKPSR